EPLLKKKGGKRHRLTRVKGRWSGRASFAWQLGWYHGKQQSLSSLFWGMKRLFLLDEEEKTSWNNKTTAKR
ncbi:MAG: hypothetical protein WCC10_06330, partial [Tumebacillaceae bacterium]